MNYLKNIFRQRSFNEAFLKLGILRNIICSTFYFVLLFIAIGSKNEFVGYITIVILYVWLIIYLPFLLVIFLKTKATSWSQIILKIMCIVAIIVGILIGLFWVWVGLFGWI